MAKDVKDGVLGLHPQVAFRTIGDEGVIVLARDGQIQVLNEVGARVYGLIDGRRTVADIIDSIVAEFEVGPDDATADVVEFVEQLVDANAVVWVDEQ